ncbi:hypothetical protein HMPREF9999_00516 [Alloprevotella sp. oral taxon 473 str. F0040]|nr:hypothetical protein HMPREF9999_00516 [Alloprevotella sp. oral taxon 473 str. F0040]
MNCRAGELGATHPRLRSLWSKVSTFFSFLWGFLLEIVEECH